MNSVMLCARVTPKYTPLMISRRWIRRQSLEGDVPRDFMTSWKKMERNERTSRMNKKLILDVMYPPAEPPVQATPVDEISIPNKITRGPTDMLKVFSDITARDYTAPAYKYHDDPFLIPISNISKRTSALSKESGQVAARWIVDKHPDLFQINPAAPTIEKLMPKLKYDEYSDVSEDDLKFCISSAEVNNSITVYNCLAAEGKTVSDQCKEELLELLCFYNCMEPAPEELQEEKWFSQTTRKTWINRSLAEKIYNSFEEKTLKIKCCMIRGMAKYLQVARAYALYQEMMEKEEPIDVQTYNHLITLAFYLKETGRHRWEACQEFLKSMQASHVHPDLGTFNAILDLLSKLGGFEHAKKLALHTLGEMKHLGIEPSLGTYASVLNVFCKDRGPKSNILRNIMDEIEGKEFHIRHASDVNFFVTAMSVCNDHLLDLDVALKIDQLLNTGNNYRLIGDALKESTYYRRFFRILCKVETVENFFESYYYKLVPNIYTPEQSIIEMILELIELYGEWKYIPLMWTDIVTFDMNYYKAIVEKIAAILGKYSPEDKEIQNQFAEIALYLQQQIDTQREDKIRGVLEWTGPLLSNLLQAFLNAEQYDNAIDLFNKADSLIARPIPAYIGEDVLNKYADMCIKTDNAKEAVHAVLISSKSGFADSSKLAKKVLDSVILSELQRTKVSEVLSTKFEENEAVNEDKHNEQQRSISDELLDKDFKSEDKEKN